jgi:hypothetical protein
MNASEDGDEPLGENPEIGTRFEPVHEVPGYQARCTKCGYIETEYGDYSSWDDPDTPIEWVRDNYDWFERTRDEPAPTPDNPRRVIVHTVELLCTDCQTCDVCGSTDKVHVSDNDDNHMVCGDHEDHEFEATA